MGRVIVHHIQRKRVSAVYLYGNDTSSYTAFRFLLLHGRCKCT